MQFDETATHILESQVQTLSAGSKSSSPPKPLTLWRAKHRHHQQGPNPAHQEGHSPPGEPSTGIVSSVQIQLTSKATHSLESQAQVLSARSKSSSTMGATHFLESQAQALSAGFKYSSPQK